MRCSHADARQRFRARDRGAGHRRLVRRPDLRGGRAVRAAQATTASPFSTTRRIRVTAATRSSATPTPSATASSGGAAPRRRPVRPGSHPHAARAARSTVRPMRCWARACSSRARRARAACRSTSWPGNKVLTCLQNRLLRHDLSEFHSGFRAYSVAALRRIPFEFNTERLPFRHRDHHSAHARPAAASWRSRSRPTTATRSAGWTASSYARDVVPATIASRLHRLNIFYDRRFDVDRRQRTPTTT